MATLIPPNGAGDAEKESCTSPSSLRPSSWVHSIQGSQTDLDSTSPSLRKQEGAASPRISSDLAGTDTDTDTDEHEEPPLPYSKARCVALVVTTTGAAFTNILSIQAVVIALPTIGRDLNIPDTRLQWVVSSYALSFGCFLLLWGRIADLYGMKKIFVLGSAWVAVTTALNPLIKNEIAFDLFRGLQGLGAAANVPTALGILGTTFRPGKAKTNAFSAYGAGAPLGSIFGTLMAGFITANVSWVWVFGVTAILAGLLTVAGIFVIPPDEPKPRSTNPAAAVDWIGAMLITFGLFVLLFALTQGNITGWRAPWIPVLLALSVGIIGAFVYWQNWLEKKGDRPVLVKPSLLKKSKGFGAAMLLMGLFFSSFNGFLVYATYYYQSYQGLSVLDTTLRFLPTGVAGIATAFIASKLLRRLPAWLILFLGNVCVSVSNLIFALPIDPSTSYFATGMIAMSLSVFGADTTWPTMTLFTSRALPKEDQAVGGALVNAVGQVGRAVGLAIATAVQVSVMAKARGTQIETAGSVLAGDGASLDGLRAAFWFNLAVGVCAAAVAAFAFRGSGIIGIPEKTTTVKSPTSSSPSQENCGIIPPPPVVEAKHGNRSIV
ncbi:puromycin resistance protein pur8 [Pyricularia oryzae 70-15]|uniref:Puromycin resistance protein pur8 n=2 Tax=Pyricularia oryzae TaxID=318829 RepID=G4MM14_PYRO7|nr:puromycin resistance protein pur8 [Pyricularia oryzae 70-15]EHA56899.1 puromycin resistance protein pur8 [Pyricularia oryzae 70-15]ELQ37838.1 puromycin resistance protein pur8 [Pyricularia oryzae Y34]KAI7910652.1 puromycin resistance protein pur8 [Pyricularia oryzae]KAI7911469.1 puromycin resistance protein pur8 [Pyricularia oryzae]